ncbi:recombinase family protein [Bacillus paranthracis]|uniref:recombinase family protein n=1 Tax=Bacillus paranthracis TaxID=2026186 RepID=UPI002151ACCE|nr:recombinase family protein [Bacillus paranthracis]MCR6463211.1 recombinase family protein [Bacillus paranthracis]
MKKAFMYIRKSIEKESEKSLERQRDSIIAYAEKNKIEILEEFSEVGNSASLKRPQLQKMLQELSKRNDIDYILIDAFDRISREMDHFGWILSQLKEILQVKTRLHSVSEDNDYEDDHFKLFIIMMRTFGATEERIRVVERMQTARKNKKKAGGFIGGMPPLGYMSIYGSGELHINKTEIHIVKKIFELRDEKLTMAKIAAALNELGFKTRKGCDFQAMTVQRVVKHRDIYEGKGLAPAILEIEKLEKLG